MTRTGTYSQELNRSLSLRDNILITLSSVSPASSVFLIVPTLITGLAGGSVLAMLIGAAAGLLVAWCYGEVASAYPLTGGEYSWAGRLLGKPAGFAVFMLTMLSSLLILAIFGAGLVSFLPVFTPALGKPWLIFVVLAATTVISALTIKANAVVTGVCLAIEVAAVLLLVVLGFAKAQRGPAVWFHPQVLDGQGALSTAAAATLISLVPVAIFAFNGYGQAVYFAEETKNARTTIGRVILISLAVTVAAETLPVMAVILGAPDLTEMVTSGDPFGYFMTAVAGDTVARLVNIGITVAIFNALIAIQIAVARLLFASGRDRSWPDAVDTAFSRVNPRTQTPVTATVIVGGAAMLIGYFVPNNWLITATGATIVFIYASVALSALRLRSVKVHHDGSYRMPLFPLPPILLLVFMGYVLYQSLTTDTGPVVVAVVFIAVGLAWYLGFIKNARGSRWELPDPQDERPSKVTTEP